MKHREGEKRVARGERRELVSLIFLFCWFAERRGRRERLLIGVWYVAGRKCGEERRRGGGGHSLVSVKQILSLFCFEFSFGFVILVFIWMVEM